MKAPYKSPQAKSCAQIALDKAVKDFRIWIHMLVAGESVGDSLADMAAICRVMHESMSSKDQHGIKLREATMAFTSCALAGSWAMEHLKPINTALTVILHRFPKLSPEVKTRALKATSVFNPQQPQ